MFYMEKRYRNKIIIIIIIIILIIIIIIIIIVVVVVVVVVVVITLKRTVKALFAVSPSNQLNWATNKLVSSAACRVSNWLTKSPTH